MKDSPRSSVITAAVLGFCLSFGALSSMATGLALSVDLGVLALFCLLSAAGLSALYLLPKGGRIAFGLTFAAVLWIVLSSDFQSQLRGILHNTLQFYSQAYGFSPDDSFRASYDHILPLLAYGLTLNLTVAWTVNRRYPIALSIFLGIIPLLLCFVVTNTVPELSCLLVYIFANGILVLTQLVRVNAHRGADRLAAYLAIPMALALGLLTLLVPQDGFTAPVDISSFQDAVDWIALHVPFVGQTSDGQLVINFTADLPDEVNLANLPDKDVGTSTVAEVTAEHSDKVYLRIRDYDHYNGTGWVSTERSEVFSAPHYTLISQISSCSVRVSGKRTQALVPYYPNGDIKLDDGALITETDDRNYSFDMVVLQDDWVSLWRQGGYPNLPDPDGCYLELPEDTLRDAQQILSQIAFPQGADVYTKVQYIGNYVYDCAEYSVSADKMPRGEDFAIWFLNEADQGYCVHFATAATVLLRAQGIPARFVEGYAFYTEAGVPTAVTQEEGHAWVEYFVDGVGWVVLDPTPSVDNNGTSPEVPTTIPTAAPTLPTTQPTVPTTKPKPTEPKPTESKPTEPKPTEPTETEPTESEPSKPSQTDTVPSQTGSVPPTTGKAPSDPDRMLGWIVLALILLAVAVMIPVVIFLQWLVRRMVKLKGLKTGSTNRRAIVCYRQTKPICRVLRMKMPEELLFLAEKAGYSPYTITEAEAATALKLHRQCAQQLQNGRWYQKLYWRFLLALY